MPFPLARAALVLATALAFFAVVDLLTPVSAQGDEAPIVNYTLTEVSTTGALSSEEEAWARFEDGVCDHLNSTVPLSSIYLSSLLELDVRTDFFYKRNVTLAASSLGFLTPTNVPMCYSFCADTNPSTLFGFYQFTDDPALLKSLGGDWPVIALYLTLITPASRGGRMCLSALRKETTASGAEVEWQTIEYRNFTNAATNQGTLTGQVSVCSNGTIIFRYKEVPEPFLASATRLPPSVGLSLSKKLRIIAEAPAFRDTRTVAKRFEPVRDPCAAFTTSATCTGDARCGWCRATRLCISTAAADDQCPKSYLVTSGGGAPAAPDPRSAAAIYNVDITQNSCYHRRTNGNTYSDFQFTYIELAWPFPFFGRAKPSADSDRLSTFAVGGYRLGSSWEMPSCNPMWGICVNGNYTNVIAPFLTSLTTSNAYGTTNPPTRLVVRSDGGKSFRIISPKAYSYARYVGTNFAVNSLWYEMYMDINGTVEILFGCDPVLAPTPEPPAQSSPSDASSSSNSSMSEGDEWEYMPSEIVDYYTYPDAFVGLIRDTIDDPASVIIPPRLIRTGTKIRFTLVTSCLNCGTHGVCDEANSVCVCDSGFTGEQCDECASGYYGASCEPCPACEHGGQCDEGRQGSGYCRCQGAYSGATCETLCATTPNCNEDGCLGSGHGYCTCDRCVCTDDYTATDCSVAPRDPCEQYSLDGCQQCNQQAPNCRYCFDSYCYSPERASAGDGHACSRPISADFTQICVNPVQPMLIENDLSYYMLGALTGFLVVFYILLGIVLFFAIRNTRAAHYDVHAAVAAGGIVDFKAVRREREIVQTQLISPQRAKERPRLLAFVLKQISLKKLYKKQRGIPTDDTGNNNSHQA